MRLWFGLRSPTDFEHDVNKLDRFYDAHPDAIEIVGYPTSIAELNKLMDDYLEAHGLRHDYWNISYDEDKYGKVKKAVYDFGSWTRFFTVTGFTRAESNEFFWKMTGE